MSGGSCDYIQNKSAIELLEQIATLEQIEIELEQRGLSQAASETRLVIRQLTSIQEQLDRLNATLGPTYINHRGNLRNVWRQLDYRNDDGEEDLIAAHEAYVAERSKADMSG